MNSVQEHYDRHLGPVYSWMLGDREEAIEGARAELRECGIAACPDGVALDLGAGPGIYSIPLAELGYSVTAVDCCKELLDGLKTQAGSLPVRTVPGDLLEFRQHISTPAQVVLCMGDTLTHLSSGEAVMVLLKEIEETLASGGTFLATFRNYVLPPPRGSERFIPVRSDADRILTCFLEYGEETVLVHDILHERKDSHWKMTVSAYPKLRLDPLEVVKALEQLGLKTDLQQGSRGLVRIIARKK